MVINGDNTQSDKPHVEINYRSLFWYCSIHRHIYSKVVLVAKNTFLESVVATLSLLNIISGMSNALV